jgi:hypothetical protein
MQTVTVQVNQQSLTDLNPNRITAISPQGHILGGTLDPSTGLFTFQTNQSGEFTIAYVEDLVRISLTIGSNVMQDLAGNMPTQTMDVAPIIQNGYTLIPVRFMAYALGADVSWNPDTAEVTLTIPGSAQTITFAIGQTLPGMDIPAQIIDSRTMVPLRFISEFFGAIVTWDAVNGVVEVVR